MESIVYLLVVILVGQVTGEDDDHVTIFTNKGSKDYKYAWLTTNIKSVTFRVKACRQANLFLAEIPRDSTGYGYEITLGTNADKIRLRRRVNGETMAEEDMSGVLDCKNYTDFWVDWTEGILVGTGREVGKNKLLSSSEMILFPVTLSVSGGSDNAATWRFLRDTGRDVFISSRGNNAREMWLTETRRHHFLFGVRASERAKILLSESEGQEENVHLVILGYDKNTKTVIKSDIGDALDHVVETEGILSGKETRYFWLSWAGGVIEMGRGLKVGARGFLRWNPDEQHPITALGLYGNVRTEWHFRGVDDNQFMLTTRGNVNTHWLNVQGRHTFRYHVRACRDAVLQLHPVAASNKPEIDVHLGGAADVTVIRALWPNGTVEEVKRLSTPEVLSCDSFRSFWLHWEENNLTLSYGYEDAGDVVITALLPDPSFTPQRLGLGGVQNGADIEWQFDSGQGRDVTLHTSRAYWHHEAWLTVAEKKSLVFKMTACHSVQILLATYINIESMSVYQVHLATGSNHTLSGIWKDGVETPGSGVVTPDDLLDCNEGRYFWVTWGSGRVHVGRDVTPGVDTFLRLEDAEPYEVNAVSFASEVDAVWQVNHVQGPYHVFYTPPYSADFDTLWAVTHKSLFMFQVRGAENAQVIFFRTPGQTRTMTYILSLGINLNTESKLEYVGTSHFTRARTINVLDDSELRSFWVSVTSDVVQVGRGTPPYDVILTLNVTNIGSVPVRGVSFRSPSASGAEWVFPSEDDSMVRLMTDGTYGFQRFWSSVPSAKSFILEVKASRDASILLANTVGLVTENDYEITLGACNNNKTVVRKIRNVDNSVIAEENTEGILNETEWKTFWVRWDGGHFELGEGHDVGQSRVVHWLDVDSRGVHAVSVSTDNHETGSWRFSNVADDVLHIETIPVDGFTGNRVVAAQSLAEFQLKTVVGGRIALYAKIPHATGVTLTQNFEVAIGVKDTDDIALYRVFENGSLALLQRVPYSNLVTENVPKYFWISWMNGLIEVGEGKYPGQSLLSWPDKSDDASAITSYSFASSRKADTAGGATQWQLSKTLAQEFTFKTDGVRSYDQFWMTSPDNAFFSFRLQACGVASVALGTIPGVTNRDAYEVVIDRGKTNRFMIISDGTTRAEEVTERRQDCKGEFEEFILSWDNGRVELGAWNSTEWTSFIKWADSQPKVIKFISFQTNNTDGIWELTAPEANSVHVDTKAESAMAIPSSVIWLAPYHNTQQFEFRVASCQHARVAMTSFPGSLADDVYEIYLGENEVGGKMVAEIRDGIDGKLLDRRVVDDVIECGELRKFRIRWQREQIYLFFGDYVQPLMAASGSQPRTVRAMALSTKPEGAQKWSVPLDGASSVDILTVEIVSVTTMAGRVDWFWTDVASRPSFIFTVKACACANLVLAGSANELLPYTLEIRIREFDNTTEIRSINGSVLHRATTTGLLSCSEYHTFWVTWSRGHLAVGQGIFPGRQNLLSYQHEVSYIVGSMGLSSEGNSSATWIVTGDDGNSFRLWTVAGEPFGRAWLLVRRHYVTFRVRACRSAHVLLAATMTDELQSDLEIVIGGWENTKVEIIRYSQNEPIASTQVEAPLNCESFRRFWISWEEGIVEVGSGDPKDNSLLAWRSTGGDIRFISTRTPDNGGDWKFDHHYEGQCNQSFQQYRKAAAGQGSGCPVMRQIPAPSIEDCMNQACALGGNAINYNPNDCQVALCENGDLALTSRPGGYDVYLLIGLAETYWMTTDPAVDNQHWIGVTGTTSVRFKVQACAEGRIVLATIPGQNQEMAYQITIGGGKNKWTSIASLGEHNANVLTNHSTPGILSCDAVKAFWVTWSGNVISVGKGPDVNQRLLVTGRVDSPVNVNSLGVATGNGAHGMWVFGHLDVDVQLKGLSDDTYVMETLGRGRHVSWTSAQDHLIVTVQACSSAFVYLSEVPQQFSYQGYRISIGADGNQETYIANIRTTESKSVSTPHILKCNTTLTFWLRWSNQRVSLGYGRELGAEEIVFLDDGNMQTIHGVSVATEDGITGRWEIRKSAAITLHYTTEPSTTYGELWAVARHYKHLVFRVMACKDAKLLLSSGHDGESSGIVELVIGANENTESVIRQLKEGGTGLEDRQETAGVLNCDVFKTFWLLWDHGNIVVGQGHVVGAGPMMLSLENVEHVLNVTAITFTTGSNSTGAWQFDHVSGDAFYFPTPPGNTFDQMYIQADRHYVEFELRTCFTGSLYLGPADRSPGSPAYIIRLQGGGEPGLSTITRQPDGEVVATVRTSDLVDCESFRPFWVSWFAGEVRLGRGRLLEEQFLEWKDGRPVTVQEVSLSTGHQETSAEWHVSRDAGKGTVLRTNDSDVVFNKWLMVLGKTGVVFRLRATMGAHVVLTTYVDVVTSSAYEVVFGESGNRHSAIKDSLGGEIVARYEGSVLDPHIGSWFWIGWANDVIRVGRGIEIDRDVMMEWNTTKSSMAHPVEAIGFRTAEYIEGLWEFTDISDLDKMFEIKTTAGDWAQAPVWLTMNRNSIRFRVKACQSAKVLLNTVPLKTDANAYEVHFGATNNTATVLTKLRVPGIHEELSRESTPSLLDCMSSRELWLSWTTPPARSQMIRAGTGHVTGEEVLLEYEDFFSPFDILAVSLSTLRDNGAQSNDGQWIFGSDEGASTYLSTEINNITNVLYYTVKESNIVVEIRSKWEARIQLYGSYHKLIYEIIVGADNNTYTSIKKGQRIVSSAPTRGILSETYFRPFWVTWAKSQISFGRGHVIDQDRVVTYFDPEPSTAHQVVLTGTAEWQMTSYLPDEYHLQTTGNRHSKFRLFLDNQFVTFTVRGCSEGHVTLWRLVTDNEPTYRLVLGANGNTETRVWKDGLPVFAMDTPDILDCSQSRHFWVGWEQNELSLAFGGPSGAQILKWVDFNSIEAHGAGFGTEGDITVHWSFDSLSVPMAEYPMTQESSFKDLWYMVQGHDKVTFSVRSSDDVQVIFTSTPGVATLARYVLGLSNGVSTLTEIDTEGATRILAKSESCDLLDDRRFVYIWCQWSQDTFEVGEGPIAGPNVLLKGTTAGGPTIQVNAVSFGATGNATWRFQHSVGNDIFIRTGDSRIPGAGWFVPVSTQFEFSVQSCRDAVIWLTSVPQQTDVGFRVVLGGLNNTRAAIFEKNTELDWTSQGGLLDCDILKYFWISWNEHSIAIGESKQSSTGSFLHVTRPEGIHVVRAFGFASQQESSAEWRVVQGQEKILTLVTPGDGKYGSQWMAVTGRSSIVFRVKACHTARLSLAGILGNPKVMNSELVIGSEGNTRTVVLDGVGGRPLAANSTPGVLRCRHFRTFWVTWNPGHLAVGKGGIIGINAILTYDEMLHDISAVGLATGPYSNSSFSRSWEFVQMTGKVLNEHSPKTHDYNRLRIRPRDPSDVTFSFRVRSCGDAHVALMSTSPSEQSKYEVVFGSYDNTRCEIRRGPKVGDTIDTPSFLSTSRYTPVWVRWQAGLITAGQDLPGRKTMLEFHDPTPITNIGIISIGTWFNCAGDWEIDLSEGDTIMMTTNGNDQSQGGYFSVMDVNHVIFHVMSAHDASVYLSYIPGGENVPLAYEIHLGTQDGNSYIKDRMSGAVVAENSTNGMLSVSEYRPFWITWVENTLNVGSGENLTEAIFLTFRDPSIPDFTACSAGTVTGNSASWMFTVDNLRDDEPPSLPTTSLMTTSASDITSPSEGTPSSTAAPSTTSPSVPPSSSASSSSTRSSTPSTQSSTPTSTLLTTASTVPTPPSTSRPTIESSTSTPPTQPSTSPTQPSTSPTQPSTSPTQPSTSPTQPSTSTASLSPSSRPTSGSSSSIISSTQSEREPQTGLSGGQITGIVLGTLVGVALIAVVVLVVSRRYVGSCRSSADDERTQLVYENVTYTGDTED